MTSPKYPISVLMTRQELFSCVKKNEKFFCLYAIHFPNEKTYIGYTHSLYKRVVQHIVSSNRVSPKKPVHKAIKSFGIDMVKFSILGIFETKECALVKEIEYISKYKSHIKDNGYNCTTGGESGTNIFWTEEKRQKMSEIKKASLEKNPQLVKNMINTLKKYQETNSPWNKGKKIGNYFTENTYKKRAISLEKSGNTYGKPWVQFKITDIFTNKEDIYPNIAQASKITGIPDSVLRIYSKKNKTYKNYRFERLQTYTNKNDLVNKSGDI